MLAVDFQKSQGAARKMTRSPQCVFDMTIEHRPGTQHRNEDSLKPLPCNQCGFQTDWENQTVAHVRTDNGLRELQDKDPQVEQVKDWVLSGNWSYTLQLYILCIPVF